MADPQLALDAPPLEPFEWEATIRDDEAAWSFDEDGTPRCHRLHSVGMEIEPCGAAIRDGICGHGHVFESVPQTADAR